MLGIPAVSSVTVSDSMFVLTIIVAAFGMLLLFILWGAWRAYNRTGFSLYILSLACIPLAVVFAVHSTVPSSAPRRIAVGTISWIVDHKQGRSHTYTLQFKTESGLDLNLEAAATPLFFAKGTDRVAITYLDEKRSYPRVIEFRALTGPRAGYRTKVSADWFGPWLGVLFSAVLGIAALFRANRNKRSSRRGIALPKR
jgi:hypothetical protein